MGRTALNKSWSQLRGQLAVLTDFVLEGKVCAHSFQQHAVFVVNSKHGHILNSCVLPLPVLALQIADF